MLDFSEERKRFGESCTACGRCVVVCPIIPETDVRDIEPAAVMESVMALYHSGTMSPTAKTRIYSCMSCRTCKNQCPEGLDTSLGLSLARAILKEKGEPTPRGLSFLLPETEFNLMKAIEAIQLKPEERPWVTDVVRQKPSSSKTVLFTGCTGLMQPDLVNTALDLIRRVDASVQALGGIDYCCGDTNLRAGNPTASASHFLRLVEGLESFSPKNVVFLCSTCNFFFDLHTPKTKWSWQFITQFLVDNLDKLGPLKELNATITIHDACHLVRGEKPEFESPRTLAKAIPGIKVVEMENCAENALCCGGSAMAAVGKPGMDFRTRRLKQAVDTGAQIMALCCPGCQSVFTPERPNLPIQIESLITLLGRSAGICHEDKLFRFLNYRDGKRVLSEAEECVQASELPKEKLMGFITKYFK